MKITLISLDNWGLNANISDCLIKKGHQVTVIDFNKFEYKYPNILFRIYNFFLKLVFKKNLKFQYYGKKINDNLKAKNEVQDLILTIKADFIDAKSLLNLKKYSSKSIAFFNDSFARYPDSKRVLKCFDAVYSFEKADCKKYNLKFKTNYIVEPTIDLLYEKKYKFDLFNISSRDQRTSTIIKIAEKLCKLKINYKIFIFDEKNRIQDNKFVSVIREPKSQDAIKEMIFESKTLLDVQRKKQSGLTFRIFESLGNNKKMLTTNQDIKNYDFYNPNNILIIDEKNPVIDTSFFETEYEKVPQEILNKYKLENWVEEFIK